jgi:hypothetical protein
MPLPPNFKKARVNWYATIGRVLSDRLYTQGISVAIGACRITEFDLAHIGSLVTAQKIGIAFADLGSIGGGAYYGNNEHDAWMVFDRATVASCNGRPHHFAGLIIHESVHVVQDKKRACDRHGVREAAAFVVEAWAMMNRKRSQIGGFGQLAEPVAKQIKATGNHRGSPFDALVTALEKAYGKGHVCGDGLQLASPSGLKAPQY